MLFLARSISTLGAPRHTARHMSTCKYFITQHDKGDFRIHGEYKGGKANKRYRKRKCLTKAGSKASERKWARHNIETDKFAKVMRN